MKGEKIGSSKKAGVALALKAMQNKDKVGVVVFGTDIKESVEPTLILKDVVESLVRARPGSQTDITKVVKFSSGLFSLSAKKKHLIIITDALPTIGSSAEVISQVEKSAALGISVSVIGIELDAEGRLLAEKIVLIGNGRLYEVMNVDEIPTLVLQDYDLV